MDNRTGYQKIMRELISSCRVYCDSCGRVIMSDDEAENHKEITGHDTILMLPLGKATDAVNDAERIFTEQARASEREKTAREIFAELEKIWYQTSSRGDTVNLKISAKSYQALKAKHGVSDKTPEQGDRVFDKEE